MIDKTPALRIYPDGREVCRATRSGRREYQRRREEMYERDKRICCICNSPIFSPEDATFEHKGGRGLGGSRRDDRIEGNGVAHWDCNVKKGSQR